MQTRPFSFALDLSSGSTLTLQIVEGFKEAIWTGRLRPGDPVPSTRPFAEALGVSRNTVLDAYQELAAEGFLFAQRGSGSFVADPLPPGFAALGSGQPRETLAFALAPAPSPEAPRSAAFSCRTGQVDPRLVPGLALARAYRRALEGRASAKPSQKDRIRENRLKDGLAALLEGMAGIAGTSENLLLVDGLDTALRLVAGALLNPGDCVAVEALGSRRNWTILNQAGAVLEPVPVDEDGISVEALMRLSARKRIRAVLVSPRCQYPTTVGLSQPRREALLRWARNKGAAILEFDPESGVQLEPSAPLPLASEDTCGSVIYFGLFAKALSQGLPLAYVQAPRPLAAHLAAHSHRQGLAANPVFEGVLADFLLEGEYQRHLARLRASLLLRREALVGALRAELGGRVQFQVPRIGMAIWIRLPQDLDVVRWSERAARNGVGFSAGSRYHFSGAPVQAIRLGFGSHTAEELKEIVGRMARVL
ncbi:MAG: PLP-dependent aminotransferase family protein [Acidobacteria bacterium]|nr:PLP-dependent aminotransferase family protein [Acidobacteriota bacterium]MBI3489682.1 PLP-dependent aminotransferase family protein [Acidobacteriota bacterium]